jgi:hypothetical protein
LEPDRNVLVALHGLLKNLGGRGVVEGTDVYGWEVDQLVHGL